MGHCYSQQEVQTFRTTSNRVDKPQKIILIENPYAILLQLSNGNVENVPVKKLQEGISINYIIEPGIYFGAKNKVYFAVEAQNLNDRRFLEAVHSYYLAITHKQPEVIQPECAYLIREQKKYVFLVESKSLGQQIYKFVDLLDLGRKMRKKQICWQDMEFQEIIIQFCRKYSKIVSKNLRQISNIIIGNDGSIHLLAVFAQENETSNIREIQNLQETFMQALLGYDGRIKNQWVQLQSSSLFKHPNALELIRDLRTRIQQQKQNKYSPITNPSLKFIRDYISAYFYKFECYDQKLIDILITLREWKKAKQLLTQFIHMNNSFNQINEENYILYHKLYKIQSMEDKNSAGTLQSLIKISVAANYLALKCKQNNKYVKSYKYYTECMEFSQSKLSEQFYVGMAEVSRALNLNNETERILMAGLGIQPQSRILNLSLIVHLCDTMRADQAQKLLNKVTPYFRTLQMEISSAKILLTRAIMIPQKRIQFIRRSRDLLSNVVLEKYTKETNSDAKFNVYTVPMYHQTMGDSYFQEKLFTKANQQYHICKIVLKNQRACGFQLASITAAQGNCALMERKYDQAINIYNEALSYLEQDCKSMMDSIIGNRAIAKIRKGLKQEGQAQIEGILSKVLPQTLQRDYNYIFLQNLLKSIKNS